MTAATLPAVAGWDVPLLRGAVGTLGVVAGRLPVWRARVEAVGRALETAEVWSGPAADRAAVAVVHLSDVTTAVSAALADSVDALAALVRAAGTAHDDAATALALAAAAGIGLGDDGSLAQPAPPTADPGGGQAARAVALAEEAMTAAAAAGVAAEEADRALSPVGVVDAWPPVDFADLASRIRPDLAAPHVPANGQPAGVAAWWASLSATEQQAALLTAPERLGRLDGVPAWARDRANRLLLARALAEDPGAGTPTVVAAEIARLEAAGREVQLWTFDAADDLVALAVGDLDTADAVAVLVPGIRTTPADDLPAQLADARDVADRAEAAAPGLAVAAMAWIGYRTPQGLGTILTRGAARRGGRSLDAALDGLGAARQALAAAAPRTTVLAHSYGTVVVDEAARADGELDADAVVLLGSPGIAGTAADLEAPEVYDAASPLDPISWSHWFGENTWADDFGATELPADPDTLHWEYYDADRPTLAAIADVVSGTPR